MLPGSQNRSAVNVIGACAILMGLILGIAPLGRGKSDPIEAYRDPARTGAARAVVVEAGAAGILVRYPDQEGREVRAAVSDYGLLDRGWRRAFPVGSSLDIVEVAGRPGAPVIPQALLSDAPPPDAPNPFPGLLAMLAGIGGGLTAIRAARRVTGAQWQRWYPGEDPEATAALSAVKRRLGVRRVVVTPQGRAINRKLLVGAAMLVALPVFATGLPALLRTTLDAFASLHWPTTDGIVIESRLRPWGSGAGSTEQAAHVVFAYEAGGRRYRASTPEWSIIQAGWGADAEGMVARYPRGARAPVHYDPADPHRAVLRPGPLPVSTAVTCGLAAAVVLAWLWGVRVLLRPLPPDAHQAPA